MSYRESSGRSASRDAEQGFGLDELEAPPPNSDFGDEQSKAKSAENSRTRENDDDGDEAVEDFGLDELDAEAPGKTCSFTASNRLAA